MSRIKSKIGLVHLYITLWNLVWNAILDLIDRDPRTKTFDLQSNFAKSHYAQFYYFSNQIASFHLNQRNGKSMKLESFHSMSGQFFVCSEFCNNINQSNLKQFLVWHNFSHHLSPLSWLFVHKINNDFTVERKVPMT